MGPDRPENKRCHLKRTRLLLLTSPSCVSMTVLFEQHNTPVASPRAPTVGVLYGELSASCAVDPITISDNVQVTMSPLPVFPSLATFLQASRDEQRYCLSSADLASSRLQAMRLSMYSVERQ